MVNVEHYTSSYCSIYEIASKKGKTLNFKKRHY